MSEWREATIASLAAGGEAGVAGGPFGSALGRKHYTSSGVPVIRGAQLSSGSRFSLGDLVFVSPEKASRHRRNLASPGDVVITQRGTLGQVGLVPHDSPYDRYLLSQSQMKVSVDPDVAYPAFLYFALRSPDAVDRLKNYALVAGVPHINLGILRSFTLPIPGIQNQRRIAALLSAFDELIDINERRIELLEDLARSLYREWFVRLQFPGDEDVPSGSDARPPEDWHSGTVSDFLDFIGGGTPSKREEDFWRDGNIDWFTPSDLTRNRCRCARDSALRITESGLSKSSARLFPSGSVLMTSRATLGVLAIASSEASCNQGFIVVLPVAGPRSSVHLL